MAGFAYYVIQRNDTTNDSIFHRSGGMQGVYSKMHFILGWLSSGINPNSELWSSGYTLAHRTPILLDIRILRIVQGIYLKLQPL